MIIIFGFRTPSATEVPEVLYLGDDGDAANTAIDAALHPRIARLDNPILRPVKHFMEEEPAASQPAEEAAAPEPAESAKPKRSRVES